MKAPYAAVLIATTILGFSSAASAQKRKVVVEQFSGPSSDRFRQSVVSALGKMSTVDVIADKKVANVEADLGVVEVSENYAGVAGALKATAFVGGTVSGKKPKARLVVRDAKGAVVGEHSWSGANPAKLIAAVNADISDQLAGLLGSAGGGAVAEERPAKKDKQEEKAEPVAAKKSEDAEEERPRRSKKQEVSEETSSASDDKDADSDVRASASRSSSSGGRDFFIAATVRVFSRNFEYNQKVEGSQQGYKLDVAPAPGLALEFFPIDMVGITGAFNMALVGSKDDPMGRSSSTYKTTAYSWLIGAKGRIPVSSLIIEPSVGYGTHVFKVEDFEKGANGIQVAGVDYKHVRAGGGVRLPLGSGMSLAAGAHYMHILDAGEILAGGMPPPYFYGKAIGGEGFAEFALPVPIAKGVEGRVGIDVRRIAYTFDVKKSDARTAGGAVDQYLGLNLALGYHVGL